jgi:tetratricopeptide (TPR) repeat protein
VSNGRWDADPMTNSSTIVSGFPRLSEAENSLAAGRLDEAAGFVLQHLRQHRNEPRGVALLGSIALKTGALVQAEQFLRQAMALGRNSLEVQRDLASAINQQERLGEALIAFNYLERRVSDPQIRASKALILDKLGRNAEALAVQEKLVEEHPDEPGFWIGYGHFLRTAGRTDEAIAAYRRALAVDPEYGESWWALANIKSKVFTDADIATMERTLGEAVDIANVVPVHFALGRAQRDRGRHEQAFQHFSEGNRLRAETINYRASELTDEVDRFSELFGSDFFERTAQADGPGPIPIFLISMPRAGSTLLEQMLDVHPDIEAVGELTYIRALLRSVMEIHTRRAPVKVPEVILNLGAEERHAYGVDYLQRAALHRKRDTRYFLDKMPMNWSDVLFIRQILPQARFIDIRRNAMDCCFSNYTHYFSKAHASSFDLGDIGRFYVDYVRFMEHLDRVAPGLIHHVRYEELLEQPERILRGALDYLGLPWDEAVLRFHESKRTVRTPSAEQVRRPLNREGIGTWEPYAEWLGPLREALGPLADA